ncbi:glycosyltransferase [Allorhizocola rhizosphaerae]|uniref:glycosyltransferase n=1 Tax=Allorhizocola rhizosphaerae TaxID=1872709 RepID=UPI000E3CE19E|nr:glycosyltransferase [Allorhizocola rhizosphaerae]
MKILHVTNIWPVGESFRGIFVKEQVEALRRIGVECDVDIVAQQHGKADYFLAAQRIGRRSAGYDLVHVHYGMTGLAARTVKKPKVLSLYGSDVNIPWQRRMTKLGMRGVAARIYVSENLRVNAGDDDGHVVADGVDYTLFKPTPKEPTEEKVVLFGGAPDNWVKGYDVFTDVLAELRSRGVNVKELILADPTCPRSEVPRKFDAADVLLFTSRKGSEGSPSVIKEAAAMNLPVVSVNVGDAAKLLSAITPSEVVDFPEPWGTDDTRAKLIRLLADRTADVLAAGTRSNGREACRWLDNDEVARRIVEVYRQVLGHND